MPQLTSHKVNGLNELLEIHVMDEPGPGGANHHYQIRGMQGPLDHHPIPTTDVYFQKGPIAEVGANGHSIEAYLAICEDRIRSFQAGPYSCGENALALTHLQECLHWLHHRTRERVARGVEGTSAK
jgi:hypothetical protein